MASTDEKSSQNYETGPTCASASMIIYAWAMDADKLELPKGKKHSLKTSEIKSLVFLDVAFKVGGSTPIKYLVLQVHYASVDKFKAGKTDQSGLILTTSPTP